MILSPPFPGSSRRRQNQKGRQSERGSSGKWRVAAFHRHLRWVPCPGQRAGRLANGRARSGFGVLGWWMRLCRAQAERGKGQKGGMGYMYVPYVAVKEPRRKTQVRYFGIVRWANTRAIMPCKALHRLLQEVCRVAQSGTGQTRTSPRTLPGSGRHVSVFSL